MTSEPDGFSELVRQLEPELLANFGKTFRCQSCVNDLTQEVLHRLFKQHTSNPNWMPSKAYAHGIARNVEREERRRRGNLRKRCPEGELLNQQPDTGKTAHQRLVDRELRDCIDRALKALRQICVRKYEVARRYVIGKKYKEIASDLRLRESQVAGDIKQIKDFLWPYLLPFVEMSPWEHLSS